eukprot:822735-Rhodomonas_salina.1
MITLARITRLALAHMIFAPDSAQRRPSWQVLCVRHGQGSAGESTARDIGPAARSDRARHATELSHTPLHPFAPRLPCPRSHSVPRTPPAVYLIPITPSSAGQVPPSNADGNVTLTLATLTTSLMHERIKCTFQNSGGGAKWPWY